jgi:hypothetical protein
MEAILNKSERQHMFYMAYPCDLEGAKDEDDARIDKDKRRPCIQ